MSDDTQTSESSSDELPFDETNTSTTAEPADPIELKTFAELALPEGLQGTLSGLGYEHATRLQEKALEHFTAGGDALLLAHPGMGKTSCFALPIINALDPDRSEVQALILVSGRERAHRVCEALEAISANVRNKDGERAVVMPLTGGTASELEDRRLARAPHILVATPARLLEYVEAGRLVFETLDTLLVDELDEILDAGAGEDLEELLSQLPSERRTWMVSASRGDSLRDFASSQLAENFTELDELAPAEEVPEVEPQFLQVPSHRKLATIVRLLEDSPESASIAFVHTARAADQLARRMRARGFACETVTQGLEDDELERLATDFENGDLDLLVCTDAGGLDLDIEGADRVIHYAPPQDVEMYAQRLQLVADDGDQVLLITPRERAILYAIENHTDLQPVSLEGPSRGKHRQSGPPPERRPRDADGIEEGMVRLYVGIGRMGGVRPGDLVGAIANEADVPGREIGSINIYDRFSFVELPEAYKDQVLDQMGECQIRGRRVEVRPATPRGEGGGGGGYGGGRDREGSSGGGRGGYGDRRERSGGGRGGGGGYGGRDRGRGGDRQRSDW